jgi:hypothetical protein
MVQIKAIARMDAQFYMILLTLRVAYESEIQTLGFTEHSVAVSDWNDTPRIIDMSTGEVGVINPKNGFGTCVYKSDEQVRTISFVVNKDDNSASSQCICLHTLVGMTKYAILYRNGIMPPETLDGFNGLEFAHATGDPTDNHPDNLYVVPHYDNREHFYLAQFCGGSDTFRHLVRRVAGKRGRKQLYRWVFNEPVCPVGLRDKIRAAGGYAEFAATLMGGRAE